MRNAATQEALRSPMRYRHGAVITKGGKVLAQGHNHIRTGFSGPLSAHEAIVLPGHTRAEPHGCVSCMDEDANGMRPSVSNSYFSMHAEMHAITSILRGARPHVARSSVQLEPVDMDELSALAQRTRALALDTDADVGAHSGCSRLSDAPSSGRMNAAEVKTKCDRALVEGAKREQQRIAFTAQDEWYLKPRYKKRVEEKPAPHSRSSRCGAWVWPVGR